MTLWTKDDLFPGALPSQDSDGTGRIWTDLARNPEGRTACGWTESPTAPDFDPITQMLIWTEGQWGVTPLPPVSWTPEDPIRVTKADFQRRLVPTERYAINALRRRVEALSAADYADPANQILLAAEDVLQAFDLPAEFIELDHPDTFAGLSLLAYLDVLTPSRIAQILAA